LYLYYAFDNKPLWFRLLWRVTDFGRVGISRLPSALKSFVSDTLAMLVYWPLARIALVLDKASRLPGAWPLAYYRDKSFYTMRTDALDRFGTRLEQRFTRTDVARMMGEAGLSRVGFSDRAPFWCAVGYKK
jgi:hypothetical protein